MKNITASKFNKFLFIKLPSAWWCGVRLKELNNKNAVTRVKYKWFNTNPFKSMYFAVHSMAAELSTGGLVAKKTLEHQDSFAMLVVEQNSTFHKKVTGKIQFTCNDGNLVDEAIKKSIETNEPQKISMKSVGVDEAGDKVSEHTFTWSIKKRTKK